MELKPLIKPKSSQNIILFIDDAPRNFHATKANILGLLVPSSQTYHIKPQFYMSASTKNVWLKEKLQESYDHKSGIPIQALRALQLMMHTKSVKRVLLDWDKTITHHSSFKTKTFTRSTAECYFGGQQRMKALSDFFHTLKQLKIDTIILTANRRADYEPQIFKKALSYIKGEWIPIVYTNQPKTKYIAAFYS